jgi:hypothetical protein
LDGEDRWVVEEEKRGEEEGEDEEATRVDW